MDTVTYERVELVHTTEKARLLRKDGHVLWVPKSVTEDVDQHRNERYYDVTVKSWWIEKNDAHDDPLGDAWKEDER